MKPEAYLQKYSEGAYMTMLTKEQAQEQKRLEFEAHAKPVHDRQTLRELCYVYGRNLKNIQNA